MNALILSGDGLIHKSTSTINILTFFKTSRTNALILSGDGLICAGNKNVFADALILSGDGLIHKDIDIIKKTYLAARTSRP